jgi:hypothetical protein
VGLGQLLGRQGRAEIGVALTDRGQRRLADLVGEAAVARPAATPRDQALGAARPVRPQKPEHLALANADQPRRLRGRDPAFVEVDERLQASEFFAAHRDQRHRRPASLVLGSAARVTSLSGRRLTFTSSAYIWRPAKRHYGKL